MKKLLIASCCLFAVCCLSAGCAKVPMKVSSIYNPYLQAKDYKRFSFTELHTADKAKEEKLSAIVKKEMESSGFVFDSKTPQFLVDVNFSEESKVMQKDKKDYTEVTKKVELVFIDLIYRKQYPEAKMVWRGDATSNNTVQDSTSVDIEKCLLIGLLQAFPERYKSADKSVSQSLCNN